MMRWNALALSHALGLCGPALGFWPTTRFGRLAENPVISGALPCWETSFESNKNRGLERLAE